MKFIYNFFKNIYEKIIIFFLCKYTDDDNKELEEYLLKHCGNDYEEEQQENIPIQAHIQDPLERTYFHNDNLYNLLYVNNHQHLYTNFINSEY